jgi:hypothetical protein
MVSLSAHLRHDGDHGRLGFHPLCPICRDDRLAGTLPTDVMVTARAKAVLATGVLAMSAASPSSVLAAGGDQEGVGTEAPSNVSNEWTNTDAAPGSGQDSPVDQGSPAQADADEDAGALGADVAEEADPASGAEADPLATAAPGPANAPAATKPVAATPAQPSDAVAPATGPGGSTAATSPAPAASDGSGGPTASIAPPAAAPVASGPRVPGAVERGVERRAGVVALRAVRLVGRGPVRHRAEDRPALTRVVPRAQRPASGAVVRRVVREPAVVVVAPSAQRARPGDRVHVVSAGESLWSIASDLLGPRATVAKVAREVNRLWDLNSARIGTGDRDLLPVGTRLVLT